MPFLHSAIYAAVYEKILKPCDNAYFELENLTVNQKFIESVLEACGVNTCY